MTPPRERPRPIGRWSVGPLWLALAAWPAGARTITVAFQTGAAPYQAGIADGAIARAAGAPISWRRFDSGAAIFAAMAGGSIDIGDVGSSPLAAAASNGLALRVVFITAGPGADEQLVVRAGAAIRSVADLRGKRVAVAPVSTDHYMLLALLARAGLSEHDLQLFLMPPPQIVAAWHRGDIDAAFVWNPALDELRRTGTSLLDAADAARVGAVTFDALVTRAGFARRHPEFLRRFVHAVAAEQEDYASHSEAWGPDGSHTRAIGALIGADPAEVAHELSLYHTLSPAEQATGDWLGGGDGSGVARALATTSHFLEEQGRIGGTLASYGALATPAFVAPAFVAPGAPAPGAGWQGDGDEAK